MHSGTEDGSFVCLRHIAILHVVIVDGFVSFNCFTHKIRYQLALRSVNQSTYTASSFDYTNRRNPFVQTQYAMKLALGLRTYHRCAVEKDVGDLRHDFRDRRRHSNGGKLTTNGSPPSTRSQIQPRFSLKIGAFVPCVGIIHERTATVGQEISTMSGTTPVVSSNSRSNHVIRERASALHPQRGADRRTDRCNMH